MSEVEVWSKTAGGNNAAPPDGAPENMLRPTVNDVIREVMASVRRWYDEPTWIYALNGMTVQRDSGTVMRVVGNDVTAKFPADRRVRIEGSGGNVEGFVQTSSLSGIDTLITVDVDGGGSIPVSASYRIEFCVAALKRAAFRQVLESGGSLADTSKLVSIAGLDTALAGSAFLKNAAERDVGAAADQVPLNSDLGSAAYLDQGSGGADLVDNTLLAGWKPYGSYTALGADVTDLTSGSDQNVTGLSAIQIPGANGSRNYYVTVIFSAQENGGGTCTFKLWQGPNGTVGDTAIITWSETLAAATPEGFIAHRFRIAAPASGHKLGLSADFNNATNTVFSVGNVAPNQQQTGKRPDAQPSFILIEEEWWHA